MNTYVCTSVWAILIYETEEMTGERGKPFGVQEIVNWIAWKWKRKWKDNRDRVSESETEIGIEYVRRKGKI